MFVMDITPKKRSKVITLNEHTSMTQRQIAEECGISLGAVNRIIKQKLNLGTISPQRKGHCGRKRKTTTKDDVILLRNSKINPQKTSIDLKKDLESSGVHISDSTVRRRLLECGRKARRPVKKQLLTEGMKKKRLFWAKKYKDWDVEKWRRVLFSDESHFVVQGSNVSHVRRSDGEKISPNHIRQTVKHPVKKMFWGCFSFTGPKSLVPISGMMNSHTYIPIVEKKAIPELKNLAEELGVENAIFQQDSAPCHTSKLVKAFFRENNIYCLEWPGNSPDINPIENLWAIVKKRLRKLDCTTKEKMICAVITVWFHDDEIKKICDNLVASMPKRLQTLIKERGGHIKY